MKKFLSFLSALIIVVAISACGMTQAQPRIEEPSYVVKFSAHHTEVEEYLSIEVGEEFVNGVWVELTWTNSEWRRLFPDQENPQVRETLISLLVNYDETSPYVPFWERKNLEVQTPGVRRGGWTPPASAKEFVPITRDEGDEFTIAFAIPDLDLDIGPQEVELIVSYSNNLYSEMLATSVSIIVDYTPEHKLEREIERLQKFIEDLQNEIGRGED